MSAKCFTKVFRELWQQLKTQMQKNHEAQLGFLREREELIQRLELEKETRHQKREQEKHRVATPLQEVSVFKETLCLLTTAAGRNDTVSYTDCRLSSANNRWRRKRRTAGRMTGSRTRKS